MLLRYFIFFSSTWTFTINVPKSVARIDENCPDINLARECETACGAEMFECLEECGANTDCSSSCYRASVVCNDACPCHADCPFGCKQCTNPICKPQLALILYNMPSLANIQFKPMLYDYQGKNINFDFEVDKKAFVWYHSCGAWLNGEYFIISGLHPDEAEFGPIIRNDE